MQKDTAQLHGVISDQKANISSLERELVGARQVEEKMLEAETILNHKLDMAQDENNKLNTKLYRTRKIAYWGWGIAIIEGLAGALFVYSALK